MRVVFLGTPDFAVPILRALLRSDRCHIAAVFAQPDRPAGRGQRLQAPPVKRLALEAGVPVHQPVRIRSDENLPLLRGLAPDFLVVAAYGQILPARVLGAARIAPVNVHASLLPFYRGAAPVVWALLNGEKETGITTMLMEEQLDTGPILLQSGIPISEAMDAAELSRVLADLGASLILPTLEGLLSGMLVPTPQQHSRATWAPRIEKQMARLRWEKTASELHNQVRAFHPWPLAFTDFRGQRVQVLRTCTEPSSGAQSSPAGTLLGREGDCIRIQAGCGTVLRVLEVKLENRRPISGAAFANGSRLETGCLVFA